jgi:hypothetical protein
MWNVEDRYIDIGLFHLFTAPSTDLRLLWNIAL